MAISRLYKAPLSPTMYRVFFESDLADPTFYVWLDGRLFGTTTAGFLDVPVGIGQVGQVDVFDDANDAPAVVLSSTVTLRWDVGADVAVSRVEQWVTDAWVVRGQVPATGSGIGRWESAPLADSTEFLFRVVPVDGTGRDGIPREFSGVMCRWPDAPAVTVSVDSGEFLIEDA